MAKASKPIEKSVEPAVEITADATPIQQNALELFGYFTKEQATELVQKAFTYHLFKKIDNSLFTVDDLLCIIGILVRDNDKISAELEAKKKEINNVVKYYETKAKQPISREEALKVLSQQNDWSPVTW